MDHIRRTLGEEIDRHSLELKERLDAALKTPPSSGHAQQKLMSAAGYRELITAQRGKKRTTTRSSKKTASYDMLVSVCKMVQTKHKHKRSGGYVEVRSSSTATYKEFAEMAANALNLEEIGISEDEDQILTENELALFRCDGTRVLDTPINESTKWSIHEYMSTFPSFTRTGTAIKLGVGYTSSRTEWPTLDRVNAKRPCMTEEVTLTAEEASSVTAQKVQVQYAAVIGGVGIDIEHQLTRDEVFEEVQFCNPSVTFHPESVHYLISSLDVDYEPLLWADETAVYTVMEDKQSEKMSIIHQSPSVVLLPKSVRECVPLYAVASCHKPEYTYTWNRSGVSIGTNSPVLWINESGLYRCTVKSNVRTDECTTKLIRVARVVDDKRESHPTNDEVVIVEEEGNEKPEQKECVPSSSLMQFHMDELQVATSNFDLDCVIGKGAYGTVYFAKNLRSKGTTAAVKVLNESGVKAVASNTQAHRQLDTELKALTKYRHPNLVDLMGFCVHAEQQMTALVYEYLPDGSLYHSLHKSKEELDWRCRCMILRDTCCALAYLHAGNPPLIHQDIKSLNILLHQGGSRAKLGDFGFALDMSKGADLHTSVTLMTAPMVAQTNGYCAPEVLSGKLSPKSDVYSYGIVTLEVFTGLVAYDKQREDGPLAEHLEDELRDLDSFNKLSDRRLPPVDETLLKLLYSIVTYSLKRHSQRHTSQQLMDYWCENFAYFEN